MNNFLMALFSRCECIMQSTDFNTANSLILEGFRFRYGYRESLIFQFSHSIILDYV